MTITADIRQQVRQRAGCACEFCGVTEESAASELTIDHWPKAAATTLRIWSIAVRNVTISNQIIGLSMISLLCGIPALIRQHCTSSKQRMACCIPLLLRVD